MKKVLAIAAVIVVTMVACVKSTDDTPNDNNTCTPVPESEEQPEILNFIANDSVTFNQDTSGVYYHITAPGTGPQATINSTLTFTFSASLLDGTAVGSATTPVEQLISTAIPGVQDMAGYFKAGTKIQLIVPSSLAYGCQGFASDSTIIPSNSVMFYSLNISSIQ